MRYLITGELYSVTSTYMNYLNTFLCETNLAKITSLLREWDEKPKATKRTIQSLVGKRFLFLLLSNCNLFSVLIFTHDVHPLVTAIGSHTYKSLYANQGI
jgi:hypothetical protein